MSIKSEDRMVRFLIEGTDVRGEFVTLDASWRTLLERQPYPGPVRRVLGDALAAVSLLSATIKLKGALILQITGPGSLRMVVAQATEKRTVRGLARWRGEVANAPIGEQFASSAGEGRLVMTVDPGPVGERYQSITELGAEDLSGVLTDYFARSEQLPTRLWLASDEHKCAGLLLQQLPDRRSDDPDTWNRVCIKADTVREEELLSPYDLGVLHRLFGEERVRVLSIEPLAFHCTCSRAVVANTLRLLGRGELEDILREEGGNVHVECEFCGEQYDFDRVDVEQIFADATPGGPMAPAARAH